MILSGVFLISNDILTDIDEIKLDTSKVEKAIPVMNPFLKENGKIIVANDFDKNSQIDFDTNVRELQVSDESDLKMPFVVDQNSGDVFKKVFTGKRINIAVIGLDSRLGESVGNADANHIISIFLEKGTAEIISIPRDTWADCGLDDTSSFNKISLAISKKGRTHYLNELAKIAGIDRIHNYIELSFSQAIGVLDVLGFKDSRNTLQVLRNRKHFRGGDWQRVYNQGNLIKKILNKFMNTGAGAFTRMVTNSVMSIVRTDLSQEQALAIIQKMYDSGYRGNSEQIEVKVKPDFNFAYEEIDLLNEKVIEKISSEISSQDGQDLDSLIEHKLTYAIARAKAYSSKPLQVIRELDTYFDQRSWLQFKSLAKKSYFRDKISSMLLSAYRSRGEHNKAQELKLSLKAEKKLLGEKDENYEFGEMMIEMPFAKKTMRK